MFRLMPTEIAEEETARLQDLYLNWERRILWPLQTKESENRDLKQTTRQEEVHMWEDFALANMDMTPESLNWTVVVMLVLPFLTAR